jgi:hypothetical protein
MAVADYANRKYDFLALQNVKSTGESQLGLLLFADDGTSQICAGVQKLAQRWLLEFLTEKGSMPGLPARGTDFMTLVRAGKLRTEAAVIVAFNFAAYTTRVNLNKEEDATWPDDERLADAALLSISFLPGYANIKVAIFSRAGASRSVIMPIATLPQTIA